MALERYAPEPRGSDLFDLVHYSRGLVAGRMMTLREIVRADIPASAIERGERSDG